MVAEVAGDGVVGDLQRAVRLSTIRGSQQSMRGDRYGFITESLSH